MARQMTSATIVARIRVAIADFSPDLLAVVRGPAAPAPTAVRSSLYLIEHQSDYHSIYQNALTIAQCDANAVDGRAALAVVLPTAFGAARDHRNFADAHTPGAKKSMAGWGDYSSASFVKNSGYGIMRSPTTGSSIQLAL
jgi:hypothetical protein